MATWFVNINAYNIGYQLAVQYPKGIPSPTFKIITCGAIGVSQMPLWARG